MLELLLVASLGFLGSFGHCVGMCGPIAMALSLSNPDHGDQSRGRQVAFHLLLNLGRLLSYALVGAAIGGLGSVLVAGGQMAGVGSMLRRLIVLFTGSLLIGLGLRQVAPGWLPKIPLVHPLQGQLHDRLNRAMAQVSQSPHWWTPAALGLAWGLIPCGFLYAAQLKAAEATTPEGGALVMVAFGLGTVPMMVGVGISSAWFSRDRTSQLFKMGGWITLLIGVLTLMRTGDLMVDYTGHLALVGLALALVARPISKVWVQPLKYRRGLGVGSFVLAIAHTVHMLEHSWGWNPAVLTFMVPQHRWGMIAGISALMLMTPLTLTSTDRAQKRLGQAWRRLHLLSGPALLLGGLHCTLAGSSYLGSLRWSGWPLVHTVVLGTLVVGVFLFRSRWTWQWLRLERWYVAPK
ncbi:MAG: sulfite exporter TauE/SafE family protein [Cyanobacteria bacterium]|nr:sulfite exporter TauE/SafE family protein [Cyanobacteriota bacterium]MDA0864836.1 sulfite exporter TauE/SafE family protein [Cyanobacteriota bacterium]